MKLFLAMVVLAFAANEPGTKGDAAEIEIALVAGGDRLVLVGDIVTVNADAPPVVDENVLQRLTPTADGAHRFRVLTNRRTEVDIEGRPAVVLPLAVMLDTGNSEPHEPPRLAAELRVADLLASPREFADRVYLLMARPIDVLPEDTEALGGQDGDARLFEVWSGGVLGADAARMAVWIHNAADGDEQGGADYEWLVVEVVPWGDGAWALHAHRLVPHPSPRPTLTPTTVNMALGDLFFFSIRQTRSSHMWFELTGDSVTEAMRYTTPGPSDHVFVRGVGPGTSLLHIYHQRRGLRPDPPAPTSMRLVVAP